MAKWLTQAADGHLIGHPLLGPHAPPLRRSRMSW